MRHRTARASAAAVILVSLTGCGLSIPSDPDGTLNEVTAATLRAGVSPNGDFVTIEGTGTSTEPSGSEVDTITAFAESLNADVEWTVSSEEALVRGLEDGSLDLVAGGLTESTPWIDKAGVTRGYAEFVDADGTSHTLVMLVPLGENAFLSTLEEFLTEHQSGAHQ